MLICIVSQEHDHGHDEPHAGPRENLFQYIDQPNVVALNASGNVSNVIKPWHKRLAENEACKGFPRNLRDSDSSITAVP
jgi:hypothetical protein